MIENKIDPKKFRIVFDTFWMFCQYISIRHLGEFGDENRFGKGDHWSTIGIDNCPWCGDLLDQSSKNIKK